MLWIILPVILSKTSYLILISGTGRICSLPALTVATSVERFSLWLPSGVGLLAPCSAHPLKAGCVLRLGCSGFAARSYADEDLSPWALCRMASQATEACCLGPSHGAEDSSRHQGGGSWSTASNELRCSFQHSI